jgi:hypothetical protein
MKRILLTLFLLSLAVPAAAQDNPAVMEWNDARRFSAGAQAGYRWLTDSEFGHDKEWILGGTAQYALGKISSVRAAVQYGLDNRLWTPSLGWHIGLGTHPATGAAEYGATFGYQWQRVTGGGSVPAPAGDEFFVGAAVAWPVSANATVGGGADYGFESAIIATRIVASVHFSP